MSRSLTEPEIQRYSRQILLHEVGGVGQLRLLLQPFLLRGKGPALETCAAYVEGAGCRLIPPERALEVDEVGYLFSHDQVGAPLHALMGGGTGGAAPEGDPGSWQPPGELGQVPARFTSKGPRVVMGVTQERPAVAWAGQGACGDCFDVALHGLTPPPAEDSVALGSLAALVAVRLVLGEVEGLGGVILGPRGSERWEVERCSRCR